MTHNQLLAHIDRYLVPTLAESELGNKAVGILKALRAVVELHKPLNSLWYKQTICESCQEGNDYPITYPCLTIQAIEKELR